MWEKDINIHEVREIRTRTNVYFGVGAIQKINDIAKDIKSANYELTERQLAMIDDALKRYGE